MTTLPQTTASRAAEHASIRLVSREELIGILANRRGAAFATFEAEYDMLETNARGSLKRMKKTDNPFIGKTLRKRSTTRVLVTFDYDKALQKRTDGEQTAKGGPTWQQAYIAPGGRLTPLTTHKADCDENGAPLPGARFYLRCEFRSSESRYIDAAGAEIDKADVSPYLPKRSPDGAVNFHTVSIGNVVAMRIDGEEYRIR